MLNYSHYTKDMKETIGIVSTVTLLVILLFIRVQSGKYSLDTSHTIDVLQNFLIHGELFSNIAGLHRFNLHFTPIYYLIAPTALLSPPVFIFFWKLICFGTFFICINKIIRDSKKLGSSSKNLILLMVLLQPTLFLGILDPNVWDTDLTLPFIGLSFLALSRQKYLRSLCYFTLTYLVKEDMPLVGIMFGILITIVSREYKYIVYSLFSLLVFVIITNLIMPSFSQTGKSIELFSQNFSYLGSSFTDIFKNISRDPLIILESGFWLRKFASIFILCMSVSFLPFINRLSLLYLIPTFPIFGYAVLSNEPFLDYSKHYMLVVSAFIVLGAVHSLNDGRLSRFFLFCRSAIVFNLILILLHIVLRNWLFYFSPISNLETIQLSITNIEKNEMILTHGVGSPWVGHGRSFQISDDFSYQDLSDDRIKYILINKEVLFWEVLNDDQLDQLNYNLKALNNSRNYSMLFNSNNVILLKKLNDLEASEIQTDWTSDLERYHKINQVQGKFDFINQFGKL